MSSATFFWIPLASLAAVWIMDALVRGLTPEPRSRVRKHGVRMDTLQTVTGAIVDSWLERPAPDRRRSRLVLQVAPRGRPGDLTIVEAEASLVPDGGWLEDLESNMCHGSPVAAVGRYTLGGLLSATEIRLAR